MKTKAVVLIVMACIMTTFVSLVHAQDSPPPRRICKWYGGITAGVSIVSNVPFDDQQELDANKYLEVSYEVQRYGIPKGAVVGCELPLGFAVEGWQVRDISASIVNNISAGIDIPHTDIFIGTSVTVVEEGEADVYGINGLWLFPPKSKIRGFIGLGGVQAYGRLKLRLEYKNQELFTALVEKDGFVPDAQLGLQIDQGRIFTRITYTQFPKYVGMGTITLGWRF